jgi:starch phosphorylase
MLGLIPQEKLAKLERDLSFHAHLESVYRDLQLYLKNTTWFKEQHMLVEQPEIAYFSAEFGLTESLPVYSGGLGVLAGDHLKSASDLGVPLVGIGLLYQRGYFQQYLNADGWQQEYYPELDFSTLPLAEALDPQGQPLMVSIDLINHKLFIKVWKLRVGRITLHLLDTNVTPNNSEDREITSQLYGGDNEMRIKQEIVLGIGGATALAELGLKPSVYHMNEGHSAFLALERARRSMEEDKLSFREASLLVKQTTVFTTHTPVPAGIDQFPRELVEKYFRNFANKLGISFNEFFSLGHQNGFDSSSEFNMAYLAMNYSSYINGVSKLHAQVSRRMWQASWKNIPFEEIPIDSITNGVHTRSWISSEICELFDRYLGIGWLEEPANHACWNNVDDIVDSELWRTHEQRRDKMISFVRKRLMEQYGRRGATPGEIKLAGEVLNSGYLTIGFSRRFASYKRGTLIFRNLERLKRILNNPQCPVQLVFAGKAHPRDNFGKELIKTIIHLARDPQLRDRIVFLENYDLSVARYLVQGIDVWLNTPRRPMEASGTSGMKVIFNGGLNLSILDGWWCEGYTPDTGWAIGHGEEYDNHDYQDDVEANAIYDALEKEIAPTFYDRGRDGIPREWVAKMKRSIKLLAPQFNSNRMVQEYTDKFYIKAYRQSQIIRHQDFSELRSLASWNKHLVDKWADIRILEVNPSTPKKINVNQSMAVEAKIFIGELSPEDVSVELYIGKISPTGSIADPKTVEMSANGSQHAGIHTFKCEAPLNSSGRLGYSIRVLPGHRSLVNQHELRLITWADGDL